MSGCKQVRLLRHLRHFCMAGAALVFFGCSSKPAEDVPPAPASASPATPAPSGPTGRIRGVVRLKGQAPAAAVEPVTENQNVCGNKVSVSRLALGAENGVQRAFVYLDGVPAVHDLRPQQAVVVDQKNCQYAPYALAIPAGTKLEMSNSDPILHNVHAKEKSEDGGQQTIFNIAMPVQGQRVPIDPGRIKPGIITLSCEAGHPWMNAHIFVADHPYVAVTDEKGGFVIPDVPVGKYRIKMWHEGVTMKKNNKALQRYDYEDPYEITQDVVVEPNGEAVVNFDFSLRAGD